jgi:hypothetical protein
MLQKQGARRVFGQGAKPFRLHRARKIMTWNMSRRSLLAGAGHAVAGTTVGQLLAVAQAQESVQTQHAQAGAGICLTMMFMAGARARFESDKYVKKHLPLLRRIYGDSVERIELRTTADSAMGVPSTELASSTMWIRDVPGFSQKLGASAVAINADLDEVSKGNRLVQTDRIVLGLGEDRSQVQANSHVFSLFYPAARGAMPGGVPAATAAASFDTRYFTDAILPKLFSLYGSNAVRRLEATVGMDQGGQKAAQTAAYHLYIRDREAYDNASQTAFGEIQKDAVQFSQGIFPFWADMRVTAIV